jgi:hypothetical protein
MTPVAVSGLGDGRTRSATDVIMYFINTYSAEGKQSQTVVVHLTGKFNVPV